MLLKKIIGYHLFPACIAFIITSFVFKINPHLFSQPDYSFSSHDVNQINGISYFEHQNLSNQVAFSIALKRSIPILFGSSELTSSHLEGLASNFFNKNKKNDQFFSIGHAGFQSFAILTSLVANRTLLKKSKITIILSPGWFEEHTSSGTSLKLFFEFCPPNYLYQIYSDTTVDIQTKQYIGDYLYRNYEKISKPDATIRRFSKNDKPFFNKILNYPFNKLNDFEISNQIKSDFYLTSQKLISNELEHSSVKPYRFYNRIVNWDSLVKMSIKQFNSISNNNNVFVENEYYNTWVKPNPKKTLYTVSKDCNREFKDFEALIHFLKVENIKPLFVIIPLNNRVYSNVEVLCPIISDINKVLARNKFKVLDMFTPNVVNYQPSVLEDIMHPYNTGWYQIDKFILDNYHD